MHARKAVRPTPSSGPATADLRLRWRERRRPRLRLPGGQWASKGEGAEGAKAREAGHSQHGGPEPASKASRARSGEGPAGGRERRHRHLHVPQPPIWRRLHGFERFVITRGGEYGFLPSLAALRWLTPETDGRPAGAKPTSRTHSRRLGWQLELGTMGITYGPVRMLPSCGELSRLAGPESTI